MFFLNIQIGSIFMDLESIYDFDCANSHGQNNVIAQRKLI